MEKNPEEKEEKKKSEEKKEEEEEKKEEPQQEESPIPSDQLLQFRKDTSLRHRGEIKSEYKFWSTQPVPQLNRDCKIDFGPINNEKNMENIPKEPYTLPEGFEWKEVDLSQSNEVDKLYEFLKSNYIGDESHLFGTEYSKDFLKWFLSPPGMYKEWLISVLREDKVKNKKKMIGFISAIPSKIYITGTEVQMAKINFLCVKKEFRNKRLTPVLIKEITRRVNLKNIWQGVYAS